MKTLKKLPVEVTYLDILKTVAIILMIIDHIGYYFFPENYWFRAIGRACVPVWFFLIGYANTRELPNRLLIAALILALADLILFQRVFSLNILVSFIIQSYAPYGIGQNLKTKSKILQFPKLGKFGYFLRKDN